MTTPVAILLGVLTGYLVGAIPFGIVIGRLAGVRDVREQGSGKTGFTNALRALGIRWAGLVVAGDIVKGLAPVLFAHFVLDSAWAAALAGAAAVIGHIFPVYIGFRGGRGVSTAFGAFLGVQPIAALAVIGVSLVVLVIWRYASLMSVIGVFVGFVVVTAMVFVGRLPEPYLLFALLTMLAVELSHLENMRRLLAGTEPKIGQGGGVSGAH
jgi:acyl phosphate:glycerol-3-phosphate acyltransferase